MNFKHKISLFITTIASLTILYGCEDDNASGATIEVPKDRFTKTTKPIAKPHPSKPKTGSIRPLSAENPTDIEMQTEE